MLILSDSAKGASLSEAHWTSLRFFCFYRVFVAGLLFASSFFHSSSFLILGPERSSFHFVVTSFYLAETTASLLTLHFFRRFFNRQLSVHVLVDVLVLTLLIHTEGGLRSGLGAMLLVSLAGAGLVGHGRLVLFYAATATVVVLGEQTYRALGVNVEMGDFFQTGLFCAGFFAVAISARLLASRVIVNEELAKKRGIELRNQTLISQRIIEEMQDGVLVLSREGLVKQSNPRAEQLLGLSDPSERWLLSYSTELAQSFSSWCERPGDESVLVRAPASGMHLRARFVPTDSSERDVLVFLEDMGRIQEHARQLKLAALGRLTANIAHEIRNPLSAINHAGELLREESSGETDGRLLRIVIDNTHRVERIVSDVLELGRRDRAYPEKIDLRETLPVLVDEYVLKEKLTAGVIRIDCQGAATMYFDRSHFHQVIWNLLGNALRHSCGMEGSVRLLVRSVNHEGWVQLHVIDDGKVVDVEHGEHIFEPFFTTHSQGTGLGLYIARELCDANGARLELVDSESGADFCVTGRTVEWR